MEDEFALNGFHLSSHSLLTRVHEGVVVQVLLDELLGYLEVLLVWLHSSDS